MIEASKTTREITTTTTEDVYTLTLSGADAAAYKKECESLLPPVLSRRPTLKAIYAALSTPARTPAVGDTVRVVEDDPTCRTGEFVGKIGELTDVTEPDSDGLGLRVRFPDSEDTPHRVWWVKSVEIVESAPESAPAPLAKGDKIRVLRDNPRRTDGWDTRGIRRGAVLTVDLPEADDDGDIFASNDRYAAYFALSGPYAADWERVPADTSSTSPLKVGDKIRILQDSLQAANVRVGDIITVHSVSVSGDSFTTDAPRSGGTWSFRADREGTGFERVTDVQPGDRVALMQSVGPYARGAVLSVTVASNGFGNFRAKGTYSPSILLGKDAEGRVWKRAC